MGASRRIMIVEDEPNVRLVFRTALAGDEYTLSTAPDGETALRWLREDPGDLVLLDLRMPGMDGMEVLRRLRAEGIGVPVVIVSAHDEVPNVVQAMRLGAIDFLPKPTTPQALRRVVAEVLSRRTALTPPVRSSRGSPPAAGDELTRAKAALNRRAFGEAEESLRRAVGRDPGCAEAHYLLGALHELKGEPNAAHAAYLSASQADAEYEPARFRLMQYFGDRLM
jgi:DNA-binding NtrC family response regulator